MSIDFYSHNAALSASREIDMNNNNTFDFTCPCCGCKYSILKENRGQSANGQKLYKHTTGPKGENCGFDYDKYYYEGDISCYKPSKQMAAKYWGERTRWMLVMAYSRPEFGMTPDRVNSFALTKGIRLFA